MARIEKGKGEKISPEGLIFLRWLFFLGEKVADFLEDGGLVVFSLGCLFIFDRGGFSFLFHVVERADDEEDDEGDDEEVD